MPTLGESNLLILGCSQKKKLSAGPAIEVYDGPLFRTVRRRLPQTNLPLEILIVSARYGIVRTSDFIEPYDNLLPRTRCQAYADKVSAQLIECLPETLDRVLVLAPNHYVNHLPLEAIRTRAVFFETFSGRLGKCQSRLLDWLGIEYSGSDRRPNSLGPLSTFSNPIELGGIQEASHQLSLKTRSMNRVTQWYALVDGRHIPVKRLVSVLTGAPVSSFETCHALALLHRNGIETCRFGA